MILNSLGVDPLQIWKYRWRWYVDDMLNCCRSLENIKQNGITIEEFSCLAKCNGLQSSFYRFNEISKEQFINDIKRSCSSNNEILVVSYDRKILGQTGSGHFSPIGLYNIENNMVLIFDVARFKYPLHWCSVDLLWDSFQTIDKATMKARGYILLKKDEKHNSCIKLILNKFDFKKILENINDISIYVNTIENYIESIYNILPDHEIIELNENNIEYNDKIIQNIKKTLLYENVSKIKKDEKGYFTIFLYSFNLFILENKLLNINIIKKLENLKEILDLDLEKEINIIKYKLYNLQNCCKYEICKFN
jgi:glutathione gamma-glutamylcysteinyltransferase